jgi:hypothetical protein
VRDTKVMSHGFLGAAIALATFVSCGSDAKIGSAATKTSDKVASTAAAPNADEKPNACPVEGCKITITGASRSGDEIALTLEANFQPDFERNHMHFFWDSQEPGAVSSDFAEKGFAVQGKWHPTDVFPNYSTQADASVKSEFRGTSTTICVTAANTDHAVLDTDIVTCRDVSDLLE